MKFITKYFIIIHDRIKLQPTSEKKKTQQSNECAPELHIVYFEPGSVFFSSFFFLSFILIKTYSLSSIVYISSGINFEFTIINPLQTNLIQWKSDPHCFCIIYLFCRFTKNPESHRAIGSMQCIEGVEVCNSLWKYLNNELSFQTELARDKNT